MTHFLNAGPADASAHILLAHGAGAAMTSPFLETITRLLTERHLQVSRFEFDYMAARREGGKRRPPPRAELLSLSISAQSKNCVRREQAGKSCSSAASRWAVASPVWPPTSCTPPATIDGLVCLGYPFHPPDKPSNLRTAHLEELHCPTLIVQGERDPFGSRAEVESYRLSPAIQFAWAGDGDHDLGPRGGSGFTRAGNLALAADAIAAFADGVGKL